MKTLKDAPKALFPRVSKPLTRRYEELVSGGKLGRIHPFDLQLVRLAVELCELCMGHDVDSLDKWTFANGSPIQGLPPFGLEEFQTAPLEPSLGDDMEAQIIYIAGRILYSGVYRRLAKEFGYDPDDAKEMYEAADRILGDTEERLISAGVAKVVNKDILATLFQMTRMLRDQLDLDSPQPAEIRAGQALVKAAILMQYLKMNNDFLEPLDPTDPPPYFSIDWWLEREETI